MYNVSSDNVSWTPLTHFPPMMSLLYSALFSLGCSYSCAPSILAIACWALFLFGYYLVVYKLTARTDLSLVALVLIAITWPVINLFTGVGSEQVFVVFLVYAILILHKVPNNNLDIVDWVLLISILAAMMLTRYAGIFLYASVGLWWLLVRLRKGDARKLFYELPLLALAVLPLMAWILHNIRVSGHLFGPSHLTHSSFTWAEVTVGFAKQSTWLFLATVRPIPVYKTLGPAWLTLFSITTVVLVSVLLMNWRRVMPVFQLTFSPISVMILGYLSIFTLFKPFFLSYPMNERFMSIVVILCQLLLFACLSKLSIKQGRVLAALYSSANVILLLVVLQMGYSSVDTTLVHYGNQETLNDSEKLYSLLMQGVPTWILQISPRLSDLQHYHSDIVDDLDNTEKPFAVITNAPSLFTNYYVALGSDPIGDWIDNGTCEPAMTLKIIVIDRNRWSKGLQPYNYDNPLTLPEEVTQQIISKCPAASVNQFNGSSVYTIYGR